MLQHETCLPFGPLGVMEIFWGKITRFCYKITESWENCMIIISILNPEESFYNNSHRLSLNVSNTICFLFWSFCSKMSRFFVNLCEAIKYWVLWNSCIHKFYIIMQSVDKRMLILRLQCIWEIIQYNLFHVQLMIFTHILCIYYFLNFRYLLDN
jgi:hypothetical protein